MRTQLIELGFDVPVRKYLYERSKQSKSDQHQLESRPTGLQHAAIASIGIDHAREWRVSNCGFVLTGKQMPYTRITHLPLENASMMSFSMAHNEAIASLAAT